MNNYNKHRDDKDYELLRDIYEYLKIERGVVLLKPMDESQRDRLIAKSREFPMLKGAGILEDEDRRLYFRIYHRNTGFKSSMEHQKQGDAYFYKENYDSAIECYKNIIECYDYVNAHVFEMLGLSYFKKGEEERAADYLIISSYISSLEESITPRDYSPLINSILNNQTYTSYIKRNYIDKDDVFNGRELIMKDNETYGIVNIKQIREFAAKNGITMEEAGNHFGLNNEQKDLLKLIVAREYYRDGNFKQGDMFLNNVEETKAKSNKVREVLKEVRNRKRFYQYRDEEKEKVLTYTKPGKRIAK